MRLRLHESGVNPADANRRAGATLGIPSMTAHRCLFADGPVDGLDVLVTGGASAVGHYAIQLAKAHGARVFTTVSNAAKAAHARRAARRQAQRDLVALCQSGRADHAVASVHALGETAEAHLAVAYASAAPLFIYMLL